MCTLINDVALVTLVQHPKAHTKPPQSCEKRKPAPPDEEQFNAPTTGGRARHNASVLAVSNMSCYKVFGADYRLFSL